MSGALIRLPVGHDGVRADDEEEVGPVEVRHRNQREVSEHAQRRQHLRQLVGGARGVEVSRPERLSEGEPVGQQPEVVGDGVAVVERDGVAAVAAADGGQPAGGAVEGFVPGGFAPTGAGSDERLADAVGVMMQIGEGRRLRADVAAAEGIVGVAADGADAWAVDVDQQAAHRLAERTGGGARTLLPAHVRTANQEPQGRR